MEILGDRSVGMSGSAAVLFGRLPPTAGRLGRDIEIFYISISFD
jgi:hypothetical protein